MTDSGRVYGYNSEWFLVRKDGLGAASWVIGGVTRRGLRWTRVLSERAAQMLWFRLTQILFPEQRELLVPMDTLPIRSSKLPTVTNQFLLDSLDNGDVEITGVSAGARWTTNLSKEQARELWTKLNQLLFAYSHP